MAEEEYVLTQLISQPGGRKRLIELSARDDPALHERITGNNILALIKDPSLLAAVLSGAWRYAFDIALVCRRFAAAVRMRAFWMPALREQIRVWCHRRPYLKDIGPYVDPFFRFPSHVPHVENWPWFEFLKCCFDDGYLIIDDGIIGICNHTNTRALIWSQPTEYDAGEPSVVWVPISRETDQPDLKHGISVKRTRRADVTRSWYEYGVRSHGDPIWADARIPIVSGPRLGTKRRWIGQVMRMALREGGTGIVHVMGAGYFLDE